MTTKESVKRLWKLCFEDSEAFIEMYFKLRYKSEINVAIESGNEVISALQMIPYPMTFCNRQLATSYISGACTHPDFRERGVMRQLLSQAFTRMWQNAVYFSTLIPAESWLFDYYARMGYAPVFRYSTKEFTLPEFMPSKEIKVEIVSDYQEEVYAYLNRKMAERPCCIQHTAEDFQVIMADLAVSGGNLFVAKSKEEEIKGEGKINGEAEINGEGEIKGIAIAYRGQGKSIINELFAETKDAEYNLLHHIGKSIGFNRIIQLLPPQKDLPQHSLGMARIINAREVLQLYAATFPEDEMQVELLDKQLSVNNGYYYLCKGKCMYSAERLSGTHIQMGIGELTERILRSLHPYMSLMLN